MNNHDCPKPSSRNRDEDLKVLAVAVVRDRLGFSDRLSEHIADTPDLLVSYVQRALHLTVFVDWDAITDEELPAVTVWENYCTDLYDAVQEYVVKTLLGAS
jgi:hypothetical protein